MWFGLDLSVSQVFRQHYSCFQWQEQAKTPVKQNQKKRDRLSHQLTSNKSCSSPSFKDVAVMVYIWVSSWGPDLHSDIYQLVTSSNNSTHLAIKVPRICTFTTNLQPGHLNIDSCCGLDSLTILMATVKQQNVTFLL